MEIKKDNELDISGNHNFGIVDNSGNITINNYNATKKSIDKFLNLVPQYDFRQLIDRIDITSEIHQYLQETIEIVILSGVGGIGKTTISLAYCNNTEITKDYDHIAWVTVTDDLQSDMMNKLSNEETGYKYYEELSKSENFYNCISTLSKINGRNLLIIDNANNPKEIVQNKSYLESLRWKVLITSRTKPDECRIINIDELEYEHSKNLFLRYYKKNDVNDDTLKFLFQQINYHTLLVELLAKTGNKNPLLNLRKLSEIIQKQDNLKEPLLQKKITIANPQATLKEIDREYKLYDYIIAIFDTESLSNEEKDYLKYFSVLPHIEISFQNLKDFFQIPDEKVIDFSDILDDLVKKGWLMQNILQNEDNIVITYKCHQLVQTVLREKLQPNSKNCNLLFGYFGNIAKHETGDNYSEKKWIVPYCESIINNISDGSIEFSLFLQYYSDLLRRLGNRTLPIKYAKLSIEIRLENANEETVELSKAYHNYSRTLSSIGRNEESLELKLKSLRIRENLLPQNDILIAKAYKGIGNTYRTFGEYETSFNYYQKAIRIYEENEQTHPLDLADVFDALGQTYSKMNKLDLSLELRFKVLEIRNKFLRNENHPIIATTYNNIGIVLSKLFRLEEALKFHIQSLEIKNELNDKFGPTVAVSYNNIATVYRKKREFNLAIRYANTGLEMKKQIYHSDFHTSFGFSYNTFAEIYFDIKQINIAKEFIEKALEIRKNFYKSKNSDLLQTIKTKNKIDFALLEERYFEFRREIKLSLDITPVNLQLEKEIFLAKHTQNEQYNPVFKYSESDNINKIEQLEVFLDEFRNTDFHLSELYKQNITDTIEWIKQFRHRDENFNNWISGIYGKPDNDIYESALAIVERNITLNKQEKNINSEQAKDFITLKLSENGYKWNVEIVNNSAKMSVNSLLQTIKIKDTATFTEKELQRLFVHEIETHVLRNENGKTQRYEMFSIGFPDYIQTEEGLAILSEKLNNLRDETDELRYALRVVLCYKSFEMDFWDLFNYANQYFDSDIAFDMVARVKRGLVDTSQLGGYTKDQVYFTGYYKVKDLPKETLKKLYVGKVGIHHIELIDKFDDINFQIKIPSWIENIKDE